MTHLVVAHLPSENCTTICIIISYIFQYMQVIINVMSKPLSPLLAEAALEGEGVTAMCSSLSTLLRILKHSLSRGTV